MSWEESDDQWTDTVDRQQRNKEKKRRARINRMEIETKVTTKSRHILGIGPVYQKSVDHFYHIVGDYGDAKRMAVQEYLKVNLRFNEREIEEMEITDTQVSAKGENILYIATNDEGTIREIRARVAQCQDPDLNIQDFIPPNTIRGTLH